MNPEILELTHSWELLSRTDESVLPQELLVSLTFMEFTAFPWH